MKITACIALALPLILGACGAPEIDQTEEPAAEAADVHAAATCAAYLLDLPNFSGPLPPFPVNGVVGQCVTLPSQSVYRTSSFRLAGCRVRFFDQPKCLGNSYSALTSGVMPAAFDNRTVSLLFF